MRLPTSGTSRLQGLRCGCSTFSKRALTRSPWLVRATYTAGWCMSRSSSRCMRANLQTCFVPPTVYEAEMADRAVLDEVFQLCFSGHSLDDALAHVVVDRDMLRHVLVERPKVVKAEKEKTVCAASLRRTTPSAPQVGFKASAFQLRWRAFDCQAPSQRGMLALGRGKVS